MSPATHQGLGFRVTALLGHNPPTHAQKKGNKTTSNTLLGRLLRHTLLFTSMCAPVIVTPFSASCLSRQPMSSCCCRY
jgi:hypothetical protein